MDLANVSLAGKVYLEQHRLKDIMVEFLEQLAIEMPSDPMAALADMVQQRRDSSVSMLTVCDHPWCGMKVPSQYFEEHRKACTSDRWTKCIRCDQRVEAARMHQHRMNCHLVSCPQCGECVLPRMLGMCPLTLLHGVQQRKKANPRNITGVAAPLSTDSAHLSESSISLTSVTNAGVSEDIARKTLQGLWRRRRARGTFSALAFQVIWNLIDFAREGKVARTSGAGLVRAMALFGGDGSMDVASPAGSPIQTRKRKASVDAIVSMPAPHSSGVGLPAEVERITTDYTDAFRNDIFDIIHARQVVEYPVACKVIADATKLLSMRPVVVHMSAPTGGEVVVVGDLHGQLKDLLHIMRTQGQPSDTKYFVFNGDFVDRGPYGIEVLLYLYVLLCSYPQYVWMNRGNHEDFKTNCEYGFNEELLNKYDDDGKDVMEAVVRSFKAMPLVTVMDKRVAVLHGGVPRHIVTLERIALIGKIKDIPTVEQLDEDDEIVCDILWSDPVERYKSRALGGRHQGEHWRTSARGCGIEYLDAHTEQFLQLNGLEMVVRSHEMVAGGYEVCHQGRCATVFSASDYCGVSGNRAAIVVFSAQRDEPVYQTWFIKDDVVDTIDFEGSAVHSAPTDGVGSEASDVADSFDEAALLAESRPSEIRTQVQADCVKQLHEMMWIKRYALMSNFAAVDTEQCGAVSKVEWCEVVRKVLEQPDLPWYYICSHVARVVSFREVPSVRYAEFVASVDSECGRSFELNWIVYIVKAVFGSMELPDDLKPATKEHERLARRRHSSISEQQAIGDCCIVPADVSALDAQPPNALARKGSTVQRGERRVVLSPNPPSESSPLKSNTVRLKLMNPTTSVVCGASSDGPACTPGDGDGPLQHPHFTSDAVPALAAAAESGAVNMSLDLTDAPFGAATGSSTLQSYGSVGSKRMLPFQSTSELTAFRFNFNYFVAILRAKSPAAAQLEDTDLYVLFRFFDQDRDGHVVLSELMELVALYCRNAADDDDDSLSDASMVLDALTPRKDTLNESAKRSQDFNIVKLDGPEERWIYPAMMMLQRFFLVEQNSDLRRMFRYMDRDRDGWISADDFQGTIKKMNRIVPRRIEGNQMQAMFNAIAGNPDACAIDLDRFVAYFSVHVVNEEFHGRSSTTALGESSMLARSSGASTTLSGAELSVIKAPGQPQQESSPASFATFLSTTPKAPKRGGQPMDPQQATPTADAANPSAAREHKPTATFGDDIVV